MAAATALHCWLALTDHGIYWPDEIYQSLEQAHRVAFGAGLMPWEFRDGASSWLLPGAIAGLWRLAAALGVESSLTLVVLARLCMALGSGAAVWLCARIAERGASARAGCVAAGVLAVLPLSVVLGQRTLPETASAPLVALAALYVLQRSARAAALAGAAIALATLLRNHNGLFALTFAVWLVVERRQRELIAFVAAGAAGVLAGGLLDWATWGSPFHSLTTCLQFSLSEGGASTFRAEPFFYYARSAWDSTGPALLVFAALALWGSVSAPALGLSVLGYLLAHSSLPHKELRFLLPAAPLFAALVGIGAERVLQASRARAAAGWAAIAAALAGAVLSLPRLTHARMGQHTGTSRAERSVWRSDEDVNLLLASTGREPDVCGLGVLGLRDAWTGGYTYFHRAVPLVYANRTCGVEANLNYLLVPEALASALVPEGYVRAGQRGALSTYRRSGVCAPLPGPRQPLLEEADDMGLGRTPAARAVDGTIRIDPRLHAGAFGGGWAPGEMVDCEPARWAVGRRASVQFSATPNAGAYALRAELGLGPQLSQQRLKLFLNGQLLFDERVPERPRQLYADVPAGALEYGDNQLAFEFSETWRPGGDDDRELAAQLRSLELAPLAGDFEVEVSAPGDAAHLTSGFSDAEGEGLVRFVQSDGPASVVAGTLIDPDAPHVLELTARAVAGTNGRVHVFINDRELTSIQLGHEWSTLQLFVGPALLRLGLNRVRFEYEQTVIPAQREPGSTDQRRLSMGLARIRLAPTSPVTTIDLGTAEARPALLEGWSVDEREEQRSVVWSVGRRSALRTSLLGARLLELEVRAYPPVLPLRVDVAVDGRVVGAIQPSADWSRQRVALPVQLVAERPSVVELRFDHGARPARHEPGSVDEREVALRVDRLDVVR